MKVLLVEDNEILAKLIKNGLESEGFAVDCLFNGEKAEKWIIVHWEDYSAIVMDWMLPGSSGVEICQRIREKGVKIPILLLTAKDGTKDVIAGLNAGADDYLVKPFSFDVFLARLRAILRRPNNVLPLELKIQDLTLNPAMKKVFKNGEEIKLTLKEFSLLEYLMRYPNQVHT